MTVIVLAVCLLLVPVESGLMLAFLIGSAMLIAGIGLNMIYDKHIPVGNLLPAIFLPMLYIPLTGLF